MFPIMPLSRVSLPKSWAMFVNWLKKILKPEQRIVEMQSNQQKRLKIVMVLANHSYPADPRVRNEAETLSSAGHELTVLAPRAKKQAFIEAINGVRVLRFPAPINASGTLGYALEFAYVTIAAILGVLVVWA